VLPKVSPHSQNGARWYSDDVKNILKKLMGAFTEIVLEWIVSGLFGLALFVQAILLCYLAYLGIYEPIAANPGARDGMGLLIVMGGIFMGVVIIMSILASIQKSILKQMFPWWRPPD
jgi:hypothetical protein